MSKITDYRGPEASKTSLAYQQHSRARLNPAGRAFCKLLEGFEEFAAEHKRRYESLIGEDYYTGEHWKAIGEALQGLLNCEIGGFDPGSIDKNIREVMQANGVEVPE